MSFTQTTAIEVKQIKGKGRGVFARRLIHDSEVIERVPVLVLPVGETRTASGPTRMSGYCFEWGRGTVAVALGSAPACAPGGDRPGAQDRHLQPVAADA